jgi:hypothetical protein
MNAPVRRRGAELYPADVWKAQMLRLGMPLDTPVPTLKMLPIVEQVLSGKDGRFAGQLEQAGTLASGLEQFDGVISAAPTGGGKTFINLGVVKQRMTPESRILVVSKNRAILRNCFHSKAKICVCRRWKVLSGWRGTSAKWSTIGVAEPRKNFAARWPQCRKSRRI